jgi:hypothetical protein
VILDHIEHLVLPTEELEDHFEARMALARLSEGLCWLDTVVRQLEVRARSAAAREDVEVGCHPRETASDVQVGPEPPIAPRRPAGADSRVGYGHRLIGEAGDAEVFVGA